MHNHHPLPEFLQADRVSINISLKFKVVQPDWAFLPHHCRTCLLDVKKSRHGTRDCRERASFLLCSRDAGSDTPVHDTAIYEVSRQTGSVHIYHVYANMHVDDRVSHCPNFVQMLNTKFCSTPLFLALSKLTSYLPLFHPQLETWTLRSGHSKRPLYSVCFLDVAS